MSNLEQSRVRPGHWLIEGYDVVKNGKFWEIWRLTGFQVKVSTLAEAREWIEANS